MVCEVWRSLLEREENLSYDCFHLHRERRPFSPRRLNKWWPHLAVAVEKASSWIAEYDLNCLLFWRHQKGKFNAQKLSACPAWVWSKVLKMRISAQLKLQSRS